jgi:hypothetical protein
MLIYHLLRLYLLPCLLAAVQACSCLSGCSRRLDLETLLHHVDLPFNIAVLVAVLALFPLCRAVPAGAAAAPDGPCNLLALY